MSFETVHNFYERLVEESLNTLIVDPDSTFTEEQFEDVACLALNKLPPHYIKHDVDVLFYVSEQEQGDMREKTITAIKEALAFVRQHPREE